MLKVTIAGLIGIALTVFLHGVTTTVVIKFLKAYGPSWRRRMGDYFRSFVLMVSACMFTAKHLLDIGIWAIGFYWLAPNTVSGFEEALYFSAVTYTTVGYGDVVLEESTRLISAFIAINGLLLFGWSGAMLFVLVQRLWRTDADDDVLPISYD